MKAKILFTLILGISLSTQLLAQEIKKETVKNALILDGKKLVLEEKILELPGMDAGFDRTLQSFSLKDSAGKELFVKDYPNIKVRENGFNTEFDLRHSKIATPQKEALLLSHASYPSAPGSGIELQFFVWQDDSLTSIGDRLSIYGEFQEISRNHDIPLSNTETVLMTRHIAYHFYVKIPLVINLDLSAKKYFRTAQNKDPQSNLDIIPVIAPTKERRTAFMSDKPRYHVL